MSFPTICPARSPSPPGRRHPKSWCGPSSNGSIPARASKRWRSPTRRSTSLPHANCVTSFPQRPWPTTATWPPATSSTSWPANAVQGRVIFLLATPESGAEQVLAALDCLTGVSAAPVPTHVFSQGVESLLDTWLSRTKEALGDKADDARFFADVRRLADAPLAARLDATGADRVVEYSHDHIRLAGPMMVLYPDAQFVHVIRDGRQVVANLSSPLLGWAPFEAARRWCDDQLSAIALWEQPNLHAVRIEDLRDDPVTGMAELATQLGLQPTAEDLTAAADVL